MTMPRDAALSNVQTSVALAPHTTAPSGMTRLAKVNWTVLMWAIGVPLPLVGIIALMRGCS
jgi:hypothetical protein